MCFLAIKNYSLEKRLVRLEQEAKSMKTSQFYGMNGVKTFRSNELTFTSEVYERHIGEYVFRQWRIFKELIFVGEYRRRATLGQLKLTRAYVSPSGNDTNEIFYYGTNNSNEIQIYYECYGGDADLESAFTESMCFEANMPGVLKVL